MKTNVKRVVATFFSPTGTTKKLVTNLGKNIAKILNAEYEEKDFTLPTAREMPLSFKDTDVVVFGTPVYAGRVPNVLLKYLDTIEGSGAKCVPVVLYGNRAFDDALVELRDILSGKGLVPISAAAFVGEHSFSYTLGKGRPDAEDLDIAKSFAKQTVENIKKGKTNIEVSGTPYPYTAYYSVQSGEGNKVDLRQVKPKTRDNCTDCKLCAEICPMGSITYDNVRDYVGICIKCCACVKSCPEQAKYFDDADYLYHKKALEENFTRRGESEIFL